MNRDERDFHSMICQMQNERGLCARKISEEINYDDIEYIQRVLDERRNPGVPMKTTDWSVR